MVLVFLIRKAIAHIKKKRYTNDLAQLNNGDVECKFVCTLPCSVRDAKEHGIVIKRPGMLTAAKEGMKSVVGRDKRVFVAIECGAETILLILKPTGLVEMDGDPAEMDRSLIDTGFASSKGMKVVTLSSTEIRCIGDGNFTISPDSGHRTMRHVYTLTVDEPNNDSEAHSLQWLHAMYKLQLAMQADLQRMEGEQTLGAGGTDAALPAGWTETRDASGRVYYYNLSTGQTCWECPLSMSASRSSVTSSPTKQTSRVHSARMRLGQRRGR